MYCGQKKKKIHMKTAQRHAGFAYKLAETLIHMHARRQARGWMQFTFRGYLYPEQTHPS